LAQSDASLVLRALNGDETAFGELYDRYGRLVRAICYDSTRDVNQAQDLGQEVFLRAYERLGELKDRERFGRWLVSIARNVGREFRRGKYRDRHILVGLAPDEIPSAGSSKNESDYRMDYLDAAIEKLSEKERLTLHVYYLQDHDAEQAQEILGISRSSFYRLLNRARKKVEKYIRERGKQEG
jgi:RNA polymerase sigma-70 factor (ECF subfamily)